MQTRRALLTGASAAAAMAVAGALTPAEGAKATLPAGSEDPRVRAALDAVSRNLDRYMTELREVEGIYGGYDLPPLRHVTFSSDRYNRAIEAMIADLSARLPGDAG